MSNYLYSDVAADLAELTAGLRGKASSGRNLPGVLMGDSRMNNSFAVQTGATAYRRIQFGQIAWWLQTQGLKISATMSPALGGSTTTHLLTTQLPAVLANKDLIGFAVILSNTNDPNAGILAGDEGTEDTTIYNTYQTILALVAAGIPVFLISALPRGDVARSPTYIFSTSQSRSHASSRNWNTRQAPLVSPLVQVIDPFALLRDKTQTNSATAVGQINTIMANDGLHQNTLGSRVIVMDAMLADAIKRVCPAQPYLSVDASDLYDATDNKRGNRVTGGLLNVGGGNAGSTGLATVPSGFNASMTNMSGVTITPSLVTTATGLWYQLAFSGTSGATAPQFTLQNTVDYLFQAGDIGFCAFEFEVDAGGTGLGGLDPQLQRTLVSGSEIVQGGPRNAAYDADIPAAFSGAVCTPKITFDGTETAQTSYARIDLQPSKAISFTVRLRNFTVATV